MAPISTRERALKRHYQLIDTARADFAVAAARRGQYEYTWGTLEGLFWLVGLGAVIAILVARLCGHEVAEAPIATGLACALAGAVGTCVSVSWRVTGGELLRLDAAAGTLTLRRLGRFGGRSGPRSEPLPTSP